MGQLRRGRHQVEVDDAPIVEIEGDHGDRRLVDRGQDAGPAVDVDQVRRGLRERRPGDRHEEASNLRRAHDLLGRCLGFAAPVTVQDDAGREDLHQGFDAAADAGAQEAFCDQPHLLRIGIEPVRVLLYVLPGPVVELAHCLARPVEDVRDLLVRPAETLPKDEHRSFEGRQRLQHDQDPDRQDVAFDRLVLGSRLQADRLRQPFTGIHLSTGLASSQGVDRGPDSHLGRGGDDSEREPGSAQDQ